jgi:hypothetical protein
VCRAGPPDLMYRTLAAALILGSPGATRPRASWLVAGAFENGLSRLTVTGKDGKQIAYLFVACKRVWKREVSVNEIGVTSPCALASDVTGVGELGDNSVSGSFGDPNALADVT